MSIAIEATNVRRVLLADGWHTIEHGSFTIDSYEFIQPRGDYDPIVLHSGGQSGICAAGFSFEESREGDETVWTSGPLTAVLAVEEIV